MHHITILDAETLGNDVELSVFHPFGKVEIFQRTRPEELADRIKDSHIIITNKVILKERLHLAPNLKLICISATGTNNVDLAEARARNIAVTNVAGYSTMSVAQHTFAMLFYLYEKLRYFDDYVRSGEYKDSEIFCHHGRTYSELDQKTWGIIGLGSIGKKVAEIATTFGCNVIYYSTSGQNSNAQYQRVSKQELFQRSDVISIHAPLNDGTKNLVGYEELSTMKQEAVILNLGRGGIINEGDLVRALDDNRLAGAALDVLEEEPMAKDSPFLQVRNWDRLFITPHIAWASKEARQRLIQEIKVNIEAFLQGDKRNRVEE